MDFLQSALYSPTAHVDLMEVEVEVNNSWLFKLQFPKTDPNKKTKDYMRIPETRDGKRNGVDVLLDDLDAALHKMQCSSVDLVSHKSDKKAKKSASKKVKSFCKAIFRSSDVEHVRLIEEPVVSDHDDLQSSSTPDKHKKLFGKDWADTRKKVKKFFFQSFLYMGHGVSSINPIFMVPATVTSRQSYMQERYPETSFYP